MKIRNMLVPGFLILFASVPESALAKTAGKSPGAPAQKGKARSEPPKAKTTAPQAPRNPAPSEDDTGDTEPQEKKGRTEQSRSADDGSSTYARSIKSGSVALRYGNIIGGLSGAGGDAYWFHPSGWQLGGAAYTASTDLKSSIKEDSSAVRLNKAKVDGSLILIQGRYYLGNSFHLTGGIGQRTIRADFDAESTVTSDRILIDVEVSSWVLQMAIGNTWFWTNGFFIGADWIGYAYPLSSTRKVSSHATGAVSASLKDIQKTGEDLADTLGKTGSGMVLVLNVGFAF